jgi:hypothetical protein
MPEVKELNQLPTNVLIGILLNTFQMLSKAIEAEQQGTIPEMPVLVLFELEAQIMQILEERETFAPIHGGGEIILSKDTENCATCPKRETCFNVN